MQPNSHLVVAFNVVDDLTADACAEYGQPHLLGYGNDLGKRHGVRDYVDADEDAEGLTCDHFSCDVGSQGESCKRRRPDLFRRLPGTSGWRFGQLYSYIDRSWPADVSATTAL